MSNVRLGRRDLFKVAGAAGIAAALPTSAVTAQEHTHSPDRQISSQSGGQQPAAKGPPAANARAYTFFNSDEAAFVEAAVAVFIPEDDLGPGAIEAGVPYYIDRQLSGALGHGARMYLQGPYSDGLPQQGYQLPLSPRQVYRLGIRAVNQYCLSHYAGKTFDQLSDKQKDDLLRGLEQGDVQIADVPGAIFVNLLLTNTIEGFFGDPAYGGNHNMVGWKLLGFPGAYGMYGDKIESYRNKPFSAPPVALSQLQRGE